MTTPDTKQVSLYLLLNFTETILEFEALLERNLHLQFHRVPISASLQLLVVDPSTLSSSTPRSELSIGSLTMSQGVTSSCEHLSDLLVHLDVGIELFVQGLVLIGKLRTNHGMFRTDSLVVFVPCAEVFEPLFLSLISAVAPLQSRVELRPVSLSHLRLTQLRFSPCLLSALQND